MQILRKTALILALAAGVSGTALAQQAPSTALTSPYGASLSRAEVLAELAAQPGGLGTLADLPPAVVKELKELDLYELFAAPAAAQAPQAQPRNVREEVPA